MSTLSWSSLALQPPPQMEPTLLHQLLLANDAMAVERLSVLFVILDVLPPVPATSHPKDGLQNNALRLPPHHLHPPHPPHLKLKMSVATLEVSNKCTVASAIAGLTLTVPSLTAPRNICVKHQPILLLVCPLDPSLLHFTRLSFCHLWFKLHQPQSLLVQFPFPHPPCSQSLLLAHPLLQTSFHMET